MLRLFSQLSSYSSDSYEEEPRAILKEVFSLKRQVKLMRSVIKRYSIPETEYSDVLLPTIYVISPTYARPHQKAELTRLKNVFLHIPALHWILVEDASHKSQLVSDFLKLSDITFTHLHHSTPDDWKLKDKMRETQTVSVWPVGLVGGVMVERPQVSIDDQTKSHVTGWLTGWKPNRPFATDMAGFAVYVWHTRTEKPNMKDEERLRNAGKPTDEGIEV
ncbi:Galactosylgalactosylxylosylprotein 3-beta-glucuronosyltransferase 2-like [Homarus americanus]|uniref:Galactosylgalactosylxylosylprotein 3-beta-glucuronosyltransferase n=1 Tax=Homarus americanus TaxID=6706 RepID=A0A8J5N7V6_HOMAM|nr:Galactosylgalactosylxylosylprotein 3-beta-glucuronosyltransferase 2-like [Homarus americanus]